MEYFSLYFVSLLFVFISISLRFLFRRNGSTGNFKLPPGRLGFPIVGETLHFMLGDQENFIRHRMEKYSKDVFKTSLIGENVAVICGAGGNKFLLQNSNDLAIPWYPATPSKVLYLNDSPPKTTKDLNPGIRKFQQTMFLMPEALKRYVPIMDSLARQLLENECKPFQVVKFFPLTKKYTLSVACKLILGLEDPVQIQRVSHSYHIIMKGLLSIPINIPGTASYRALKEVGKLKNEILRIISERRKTVSANKEKAGWDILSRMLLDENSRFVSDSEIAVYLHSLMVPTYDTTASPISIVLKYLAELPHVYDMVYNEHKEIAKSKAPQELLNWEDVKKMKYSWNVVLEAIRLTPAAIGAFREAQTDIDFAGSTIPKGWKIFWSHFTTNKNPKYFPDPENFDPSRFDGDGPIPYTFLPFSTGSRMCPGKEHAKFLILVYMHNIVRKFKLQKSIPNEKILYPGPATPANGLPLRLLPH